MIDLNANQHSWARALWEQAASTKKGLILRYSSRKTAYAARFALYTARNISREEYKKMSEGLSVPLTCPWDLYRITVTTADTSDEPVQLQIAPHLEDAYTPISIEERT